VPISGSVKIAPGMATQSRTTGAAWPRRDLALLGGLVGEEGRPGQVAMAKMEGTLVRYCPSTSTNPFGIFTPTFSRPRPLRVGPEAHRDQDLVEGSTPPCVESRP